MFCLDEVYEICSKPRRILGFPTNILFRNTFWHGFHGIMVEIIPSSDNDDTVINWIQTQASDGSSTVSFVSCVSLCTYPVVIYRYIFQCLNSLHLPKYQCLSWILRSCLQGRHLVLPKQSWHIWQYFCHSIQMSLKNRENIYRLHTLLNYHVSVQILPESESFILEED